MDLTRTLLMLAALVVVTACKDTPEDAFKKIQAASCKGDVPGVFRYIDKTRVTENLAIHIAGGADKAGGIVNIAAKTAASESFAEWEDDIKRGSDSNLCKAVFESSDAESGRVAWLTPTGKDKIARFERAGDTWLLVELQ